MLSHEDNDLLCRVGSGTPMGEMMRQYWVPAGLSSELKEPGGDPLRVMLLGEKLIAFRTSSGSVGLVQNQCPHRGASLFFGRNEGDGLRCIYHGWKYDVSGQCTEMPNEPAANSFARKICARSYPCVERGGIIWTYMGSRDSPPPLPDLEANTAPDAVALATMRDCNWVQSLEGDIDTSHFAFLHTGHLDPAEGDPQGRGNFLHYQLLQRSPKLAVLETEFGTSYGAQRPAGEGLNYWRIAHFLFPFYTMIPTAALAVNRRVRAWVPMDDEHMMYYMMMAGSWDPFEVEVGTTPLAPPSPDDLLPNTSDWFGRFRLKADASNDYFVDRDKVRRGESFSGITGVHLEDQVVTESMGPILDRTGEHLGPADLMVIRTRRRMMRAAEEWRDNGAVPPGVDDPQVYRRRAGGIVLPTDADWAEASRPFQEAYVDHPKDVVLDTIGRKVSSQA